MSFCFGVRDLNNFVTNGYATLPMLDPEELELVYRAQSGDEQLCSRLYGSKNTAASDAMLCVAGFPPCTISSVFLRNNVVDAARRCIGQICYADRCKVGALCLVVSRLGKPHISQALHVHQDGELLRRKPWSLLAPSHTVTVHICLGSTSKGTACFEVIRQSHKFGNTLPHRVIAGRPYISPSVENEIARRSACKGRTPSIRNQVKLEPGYGIIAHPLLAYRWVSETDHTVNPVVLTAVFTELGNTPLSAEIAHLGTEELQASPNDCLTQNGKGKAGIVKLPDNTMFL